MRQVEALITPPVSGTSVEFRIEAYNVTNTPSFRNPESDLSSGDFGENTRTRAARASSRSA
jgi:hypothetical protein